MYFYLNLSSVSHQLVHPGISDGGTSDLAELPHSVSWSAAPKMLQVTAWSWVNECIPPSHSRPSHEKSFVITRTALEQLPVQGSPAITLRATHLISHASSVTRRSGSHRKWCANFGLQEKVKGEQLFLSCLNPVQVPSLSCLIKFLISLQD